jgi:hypothetical protein
LENGEDVLVVLPTGYGLIKIMANIKIFQLLPDVYEMLLGVTNSIVIVIYSCDSHILINALTDARSSG